MSDAQGLDALLTCPYCGCAPKLIRLGTGDGFSYSYHCPEFSCHATNGKFGTHEEAIAAWNRRTPPAPLSAQSVEPLVMPPDEWGTVVIWPHGEVGRWLQARVEVFPNYRGRDGYQPPETVISFGMADRLVDVETTRAWAIAMLKACDIADAHRTSAQGE